MAASDQKILDKLVTARIALLLKHPFFGNLATRLKIVNADDWCPTAATDGRHFFYNVKFIDSLTTRETEFLFGHEVLHNVFEQTPIGHWEGKGCIKCINKTEGK